MLHDHAELAATDQAQREAAHSSRVRRRGVTGSSSVVDPETAAPDRRSTVAYCMQTSLSASSAFRPAASFLSPGTRLASTRTTQLALLQSAHPTIICSRRAYCLKLMHANAPSRCSHPCRTVRPVYPCACRQRSTCSSVRVCHPHACCACSSAEPQFCRLCPKDSSAAAAPPHSCSNCTCLHVMPYKLRLCTLHSPPSLLHGRCSSSNFIATSALLTHCLFEDSMPPSLYCSISNRL